VLLLPHLEDKKKHPFADLDALYTLILRSCNDVDMSVKAAAVCLEYFKYFNTISPADLAEVLVRFSGDLLAILAVLKEHTILYPCCGSLKDMSWVISSSTLCLHGIDAASS